VFDAGPRSTDPSSEGSVGVRRKVQLRRGCDVISDLGDGAVVGLDVFGESGPAKFRQAAVDVGDRERLTA